MKKQFLIAALFAASVSMSAFAGNDNANPCGNNGNNCNTGGAGGHGGAGGNATAFGGTGVGIGGNATGGSATGGSATVGDIRNTNTNTALGGAVVGSGNSSNSNRNDNNNSNLNAQGQQQGQAQGQQQSSNSTSGVKNSGNSSSTSGVKNSGNSESKSSSNSGGNTQSNAGNNTSVSVEGDTYQAARIPVATAYAAGLSASNGTCLGSASAGIQAPMFGLTGGSTTKDEDCNIRYYAQALSAVGHVDAATAMLCTNAAVKEALESVGKSCTGGKLTKAPAAAPAVMAKYEYTDPIIRRRLGLPPLK